MQSIMSITKMQAAKAQLATAIQLYSGDRDPISVHSLVMAAFQIVGRICTARGIISTRDDLIDKIVPERRRDVSDSINSARNFFKHSASGDADDVLLNSAVAEINEVNLYAIIQTIMDLHALDEVIGEVQLFDAWIFVVHPELLLVPIPEKHTATLPGSPASRRKG